MRVIHTSQAAPGYDTPAAHKPTSRTFGATPYKEELFPAMSPLGSLLDHPCPLITPGSPAAIAAPFAYGTHLPTWPGQ